MKRMFIWLFLTFSCSSCFFTAWGQASLVMNGSFEAKGDVIGDITTEPPLYWCDVDVPVDKFAAQIVETGSTEGLYALSLISPSSTNLETGDTASISQEVFFEDNISELTFDIYLTTTLLSFYSWDAEYRTVFVAIDDEIIWDTNDLEIDENGEFIGTIHIDAADFVQYTDNDSHKLTFAVRFNQTTYGVQFVAHIDFIKFDKYCGGFGYLAGDISQDCYVDLKDFAELAAEWMDKPAAAKQDLYEDDFIDARDLAVLAEDWLLNTDWALWGQENTFQMFKLEKDLDLSGRVDVGDLMVFSDAWLADVDSCSPVDFYKDGTIDFKDFALLADEWGLRDWLYYAD